MTTNTKRTTTMPVAVMIAGDFLVDILVSETAGPREIRVAVEKRLGDEYRVTEINTDPVLHVVVERR